METKKKKYDDDWKKEMLIKKQFTWRVKVFKTSNNRMLLHNPLTPPHHTTRKQMRNSKKSKYNEKKTLR